MSFAVFPPGYRWSYRRPLFSRCFPISPRASSIFQMHFNIEPSESFWILAVHNATICLYDCHFVAPRQHQHPHPRQHKLACQISLFNLQIAYHVWKPTPAVIKLPRSTHPKTVYIVYIQYNIKMGSYLVNSLSAYQRNACAINSCLAYFEIMLLLLLPFICLARGGLPFYLNCGDTWGATRFVWFQCEWRVL